MKDKSFFDYFYEKTGGLHDPLLVNKVIDALKEWLPTEIPGDGLYEDAWNDYRDECLRNLK